MSSTCVSDSDCTTLYCTKKICTSKLLIKVKLLILKDMDLKTKEWSEKIINIFKDLCTF